MQREREISSLCFTNILVSGMIVEKDTVLPGQARKFVPSGLENTHSQ